MIFVPYKAMQKLIQQKNNEYMNGSVTKEEYNLWRGTTETKLDTFMAFNRLTTSQYQELFGMLLDLSEDEPVI